jgi:DNA-binding transcriptional MerR regulator
MQVNGPERERLLKASEVAGILGITRQTLYRWQATGRIPLPFRGTENNYRYWTIQDVEQMRRSIPRRWLRKEVA